MYYFYKQHTGLPADSFSNILKHAPDIPNSRRRSQLTSFLCFLFLFLFFNKKYTQNNRYMAGKGEPLREYLPVWQGHVSHWIAAAGDIPIYVFRYEDMLYRAEDVLR